MNNYFVLFIILSAFLLALVLIIHNNTLLDTETAEISQTSLVYVPVLTKSYFELSEIKADLIDYDQSVHTYPPIYQRQSTSVLLDVPFTAQAPLGEWFDPRQDYGCEEASSIMAYQWVSNELFTKLQVKNLIIDMSDWQLELDNNYYDRSAMDTVTMFKEYFNYDQVSLIYDITIDDIKNQLAQGNLVVVPVHGQILNNPFFTPPGPIQHMVVVKGYDDETKEFITNDPGTRRGENFRYSYSTLASALMDYETGHGEPIVDKRTAMIVISKN
jgi:hypothetical protein